MSRHRLPVRPAGHATAALAGLTLFAATFGAPTQASAQIGRQRVNRAIERRVDTISPRIGAPGVVVHVASADMPSITPIRVGVGAMRVGFEAYEELLTSMDGEFATDVPVPAWAQWDRVHRFIVFDIYFAPIAMSDPFHVTNEEGMVRREGHVVSTSASCAVFEDMDDLTYALVGDRAAGLEAGAEAIVEGRISERSVCGQDLAIEIDRIWDPRGDR
jgi:hypothetical protein